MRGTRTGSDGGDEGADLVDGRLRGELVLDVDDPGRERAGAGVEALGCRAGLGLREVDAAAPVLLLELLREPVGRVRLEVLGHHRFLPFAA